MASNVNNTLARHRQSRGIAAADLAKRVGVSRQTIHSIEAGSFVPNTEVALKLARALEVPVEQLFSLTADEDAAPEPVATHLLSTSPLLRGQAVRVCSVGDRRVSVPLQAAPFFLSDGDGIVATAGRGKAAITIVGGDSSRKRIVVAGCDPAVGLLAHMVDRVAGIEVVPAAASSRLALKWLKEGNVHIAGTHLKDARTGEFNVPFIRRHFGDEDYAMVTFACWEEGFVTDGAAVRSVADLAQPGVRFINREAGSGSRALLDSLLVDAGMSSADITGYDNVASGHIAAAYAIASRSADCCIATRSAAQAFGLSFTPLQTERYDFVLRRDAITDPAMQAFLDVLHKAALRRKLEALAGYDTARSGKMVL